MARPIKTGLDYFPLDCDFLSDEKVIAVKVNCGAKGIAVLVDLLCAIYRNSYYALWNDSMALMVANDLGVTPEFVGKVVEILVKYEFFDKGLFCAEKVLTSVPIQSRFMSTRRSQKFLQQKPYWLISAAKTPVSVAKTPISAQETPPKREYIDNTPDVVLSSSPPPPPARSQNVRDHVAILATDQAWLADAAAHCGISVADVVSLLPAFAASCGARGKATRFSIDDTKAHFVNWQRKRLTSNPKPNDRNFTPASNARKKPSTIDPACRLIE